MTTIIFNECKMSYSYFLIRFNDNSSIGISVNRNLDISDKDYLDYEIKANNFISNKSNELNLSLQTNCYEINIDINKLKNTFNLHYDKLNCTSLYGIWKIELDYNKNKREINKYLQFLFPTEDY
jgi:hypothetical protein